MSSLSGRSGLRVLHGISLLTAHVGDEEDDSEHDAESTDNDVADSKEVVGTAKKVGGREHEVLAFGEGAHIVVALDLESVAALGEILLDLSPKFAEVRKTSSTHPDNKVF